MREPLVGAAGLARKSGLNTGNAPDTNASKTIADPTAHFICVVKTGFTEVRLRTG